MKKLRCVVEIDVPDKLDFGERDFAKALRRNGPSVLSLGPRIKETRPLSFKEFSRVIQYDDNGVRITPPKAPTPFERLVLMGLAFCVVALIPIRRRSKEVTSWLHEVLTTAYPPKPAPPMDDD